MYFLLALGGFIWAAMGYVLIKSKDRCGWLVLATGVAFILLAFHGIW